MNAWRSVEEKARNIAASTFSDGTMRTMLYERIVAAFRATPERPPRPPPPPTEDTAGPRKVSDV